MDWRILGYCVSDEELLTLSELGTARVVISEIKRKFKTNDLVKSCVLSPPIIDTDAPDSIRRNIDYMKSYEENIAYVPEIGSDSKTSFHSGNITFVDIGASGELPQKWIDNIASLNLILVEPNPDEAEKLDSLWKDRGGALVLRVGLSDSIGYKKLNITDYYGCTSILEPNAELLDSYKIAPIFNVKSTIDVECTRYDLLVSTGQAPIPDVIKIDVQGYEFQVLHGFGTHLSDCLAIELEGHFYELYRGQVKFGSLVEFLEKFDFVLRTIQPVNNFEGDCIEVDAIFTKSRKFYQNASPELKAKMAKISSILNVDLY